MPVQKSLETYWMYTTYPISLSQFLTVLSQTLISVSSPLFFICFVVHIIFSRYIVLTLLSWYFDIFLNQLVCLLFLATLSFCIGTKFYTQLTGNIQRHSPLSNVDCLKGTTTPGQSCLGSNGKEGLLHIPQSSSTGVHHQVVFCFVFWSYPGHSLGGLTSLQRCSRRILQTPAHWALNFEEKWQKKSAPIKICFTIRLTRLPKFYIAKLALVWHKARTVWHSTRTEFVKNGLQA